MPYKNVCSYVFYPNERRHDGVEDILMIYGNFNKSVRYFFVVEGINLVLDDFLHSKKIQIQLISGTHKNIH